ncbi:DEAD/DEAH box helicase [Terrabacter sp. BE26]|uniref:DEAD/DEAH box helicase n=1 Tax=Terrabacter sp. BE26 TaxID=2898152 RepID=UPI0035BE69BD
MPADAFAVVVIDEFHHAEARTYRATLDRLHPTELLGLTATPERGDGTDVRAFFDGRVAAELRLWDALKAELLTPFHYFAVVGRNRPALGGLGQRSVCRAEPLRGLHRQRRASSTDPQGPPRQGAGTRQYACTRVLREPRARALHG